MKEHYALSRLSGDFRGETCIDRISGDLSLFVDHGVEFLGREQVFPNTLAVITKRKRDYAIVDSGCGPYVQATSVIYHRGIKVNIAAFGFDTKHAIARLRKFIIKEIRYIDSTIS